MAPDPNVLQDALRAARRFGATRREKKALIEAGIVESGLRNLSYGDRDSVGFLQQRPSQGWKGLDNPEAAATEFLTHARELTKGGFKGSAGQLAQAVQRSAFPARYDEVAKQATDLLGQGGGGGGAAADVGGSSTAAPDAPEVSTVQPGDAGATSLLAALLQQSKPQPPPSTPIAPPSFSSQQNLKLPASYQEAPSGGGPAPPRDLTPLLDAAAQLQGPAPAAPDTTSSAPAGASPDVPGSTTGPGASLSGGKSPLFEFIHKGDKDYAVKNGKLVNGPQFYRDVWDNHAGHAHAAAGPNTVVALGKLAQQMGLTVGSNPYFTGHPETGGHASKSYHYRTGKTKSGKTAGEAIDVSGDPDKVNEWSRKVLSIYGLG
jgi:hypothetical protein